MREALSLKESNTLPENSQGSLADNPQILDMWLTGDNIDPNSWPYLMSCRDKTDGSLTWHMLCDEHNIEGVIRRGMKALVDDFMSGERKRYLIGIELLCRYNNRHLFLK